MNWPGETPPGIAVFTGPPPPAVLVDSLATFGLKRIEAL